MRISERVPIKYHLAEDTIDRADIDRLVAWLKTYPRLTQGKLTAEFEADWSRWMGRKHSTFCNSGSSANLLAYDALLLSGKLKNKKVVVPSVGWATSIAPAIQLGFEPLMCEADADSFGLDLDHLQKLLQEHDPGTVVLVQVLGVPHKMKAVQALKDKHGFFLIEDSCAAVGAEWKGRKVGCFGDLSTFSFYFGHQMSTIEGGMVSTDDRDLEALLKMLRSHGWSKDLDREAHDALVRRYRVDDFHTPFVFYEPGFNLRSTDLNAYLGIGQLKKLDAMSRTRARNHARYRELLGDKLYIQKAEPDCLVSSIHFGALAESSGQRRKIVKALVDHGIETRIFSAGNLGLHPFWFNRYPRGSFPVADRIHHCGFFLPNHASLKIEDVDSIARVVLGAM